MLPELQYYYHSTAVVSHGAQISPGTTIWPFNHTLPTAIIVENYNLVQNVFVADDGRYVFIGAGAVVIKEVEDFALIVGNPGRQVGWRSRYGHRLNFDKNGKAQCPESGEVYSLIANQVTFADERS